MSRWAPPISRSRAGQVQAGRHIMRRATTSVLRPAGPSPYVTARWGDVPLDHLIRRVAVFLIVVWAGATINFFMPRLAPVNPIRERLPQAVSFGGAGKTDLEAVVASYEARFGLDQPLWRQYLRYMGDVVRLDFGVSIANFPSRACDIM